MKRFIFCLMMLSNIAFCDTINRYMNIVNNIPQMEMKANTESQAWARSARTILALTSESIAESLTLANESATKAGAPLFCMPPGILLTAELLNNIIQQTYREISSQDSDKDTLSVSQVALIGLNKQYPCEKKKPLLTNRTQQWIKH